MKKTDDAVKIARYISEFLDVYAPNFLTASEHTLKSYRNALGLYINFLETESVTPGSAGRLDEIRSIKIRHLHLDGKKPYVNLIGKRDKIRTAYLLPKVVAYINAYLKVFHDDFPDPETYLFYSRVGGKYTKLSETALAKRIKICAEKAHENCPEVPLDAHAHQFRHAKASHWLEEGINVVQVSFLLGHEQLETTMRYLDITTEDKIKALATLEDENQKTVPKKWKNKNSTLTDFCGLKK